jgi:hypothetical protein
LLASSWLEIRLTTSSCFCLQNKLPPIGALLRVVVYG